MNAYLTSFFFWYFQFTFISTDGSLYPVTTTKLISLYELTSRWYVPTKCSAKYTTRGSETITDLLQIVKIKIHLSNCRCFTFLLGCISFFNHTLSYPPPPAFYCPLSTEKKKTFGMHMSVSRACSWSDKVRKRILWNVMTFIKLLKYFSHT